MAEEPTTGTRSSAKARTTPSELAGGDAATNELDGAAALDEGEDLPPGLAEEASAHMTNASEALVTVLFGDESPSARCGSPSTPMAASHFTLCRG